MPPPEQLNDGSDSNDSDDDSDDDFGPQLPSAANTSSATAQSNLPDPSAYPPSEPATKPAAKRDEWMLLPPKQDDLSSRVDPTKLKSRGFNTGKGSKAPIAKGESGGMWTETAEEKRRRLQNEVMGVQEAPPAGRKAAGPAGGPAPEDAHSRETARKVEEYNVSLYLSKYCFRWDGYILIQTRNYSKKPGTQHYTNNITRSPQNRVTGRKRKKMILVPVLSIRKRISEDRRRSVMLSDGKWLRKLQTSRLGSTRESFYRKGCVGI